MIICKTENGIGLRWREGDEIQSKIVSHSDFQPYMYADKAHSALPFTFKCKDNLGTFQIKVMFEKYRPKEIDKFDEFYEIIKNKKITIAILQKFFFDCRKKENIIKNIKYLYDIIESHKQDSDDYIIDTMYS